MDDEDGIHRWRLRGGGSAWEGNERDRRRGKACSEREGKASRRDENTRPLSRRCTIKLALFTYSVVRSSGTVVPAGTVPRIGGASSPLPTPPLLVRTRLTRRFGTVPRARDSLSVNLTTLRFRLQNSFRRMENERNDTKGPSNCSQGS